MALGYNLATLVAGGPAPFIATSLLAWAQGAFWPIAVYMMIMALVTVVSVYIAREEQEKERTGASSPASRDSSLKVEEQRASTKPGGNA